jgi:hypothetical protein
VQGSADGRVTFTGDVLRVPESERAVYRASYLQRHKDAYWVDFGDFSFFCMSSIKAIRFVGGFARVGDITAEGESNARIYTSSGSWRMAT